MGTNQQPEEGGCPRHRVMVCWCLDAFTCQQSRVWVCRQRTTRRFQAIVQRVSRSKTTPVSSVILPKACMDRSSRGVLDVVAQDFEQKSTWDALPADSRVQTTAELPPSRAGSLWGAVCEALGDSAGPDHRAAGVWAR